VAQSTCALAMAGTLASTIVTTLAIQYLMAPPRSIGSRPKSGSRRRELTRSYQRPCEGSRCLPPLIPYPSVHSIWGDVMDVDTGRRQRRSAPSAAKLGLPKMVIFGNEPSGKGAHLVFACFECDLLGEHHVANWQIANRRET
jgi:hypothetical protein